MTCPNCNKPVTTTTRQGVNFESCNLCGGFWLTQNEMDKILSRIVSEKLTAQTSARLQAPSISPALPESEDTLGEDYETYFTYKYHGCYGRPRNTRWAQRLNNATA